MAMEWTKADVLRVMQDNVIGPGGKVDMAAVRTSFSITRGPKTEHFNDCVGDLTREGVVWSTSSYTYTRPRWSSGQQGRNDKVLTVIAAAVNGSAGSELGPAEVVYDALLAKGLLRLDAFEAR